MDSSAYQPFPNTHWSLVHRAGTTDGQARHEALSILLSRYAPALRSYLRFVRRMNAHDADDLLQAFIADRLLAGELLQAADARRGRFRTLLLTSLNHFAASRHRTQRRQPAQAANDFAADSPQQSSPESIVQAAWARALVQQVVGSMREECLRTHRPDILIVFEERLLAAAFDQSPPASYDSLAQRLNLQSPAQAANLLVTAKRMYARLLFAAIAEYERDIPDIEAELSELREALAGAAPDDRD